VRDVSFFADFAVYVCVPGICTVPVIDMYIFVKIQESCTPWAISEGGATTDLRCGIRLSSAQNAVVKKIIQSGLHLLKLSSATVRGPRCCLKNSFCNALSIRPWNFVKPDQQDLQPFSCTLDDFQICVIVQKSVAACQALESFRFTKMLSFVAADGTNFIGYA